MHTQSLPRDFRRGVSIVRFLAAIFAIAALFRAADSVAQDLARDPTSAPDSVADSLRAQVADLHAVGVRALVVGAGDDAGVALLDVHAAGDPDHPALVRAGSSLTVDLGGIPVRLDVESVGAEGVRIKAPTLRDGILIPGALRPVGLAPTSSGRKSGDTEESGVADAASTPASAPPSSSLSLASRPEQAGASPVGCPAGLRHIEAEGVPLDALLRLVADQTGANFAASEKAAQVPVRIALRNVSPEEAVAEICRARNLWFRRDADSGILRVTTMEEYESGLASFREQVSECFTLLYPNVIEAASILYGLFPDRVFLSLGDDALLDADADDIGRRVDRFNALGNGQTSALLANAPGSLSSSGSGRSGNLNGGLLSASTAGEDIRRVLGADCAAYSGLTADDAARLAAAADAGDAAAAERLLRPHRSAAGIFVTVSRRGNQLFVRTSDLQAMDEIRELVRRIDVPTPMVLLEMRILNVSVDDGYESVFETSFGDSSEHARVKETQASFPGGVEIAGTTPGETMSIALIGRRFAARLQWLEREGRVTVVGSPTLLVANNEISRIFRGQNRPLVKNITSTVVMSDTGRPTYNSNTEIEWRDVGTMIVVTPSINADRSVTLRMTHEESAIDAEKAHIPFATQGSTGSTLDSAEVDILDSRSISGTFVVQDTVPVAIGGLITETSSRQIKRVPILGRIPLLGWLFRSTEIVKNRSELVILVTPHVISTPADGHEISRRVLERISKAQDVTDAEATIDAKAESL